MIQKNVISTDGQDLGIINSTMVAAYNHNGRNGRNGRNTQFQVKVSETEYVFFSSKSHTP